jgi:hypothetical protein
MDFHTHDHRQAVASGQPMAADSSSAKVCRPCAHPAERRIPIYVQHKAKVPPMTLELSAAGLNPLAERALSRLPRHGQVPILRPIVKADALGFTFAFRVEAGELTTAALPVLLERWDERYELAKAKAGLSPQPAPPAAELQPRVPRRERTHSQDAQADQEGHAGGIDLSIVKKAIKAYDAGKMASAVSAGGSNQEEEGDPLAPAGEGAEAHQLQLAADKTRADVEVPAAAAPSADALAERLAQLKPVHVMLPGGSPAQQQSSADGYADAQGQIWWGHTHMHVHVQNGGTVRLTIEQVPVGETQPLTAQLREVLANQQRAQQILASAQSALADGLNEILDKIEAAEREPRLVQAFGNADAALELLRALLLDMQMTGGHCDRIERHLLGMPGWALEARAALQANTGAFDQYLAAGKPSAALAIVKRWCDALAHIRLTEQMGLFCEPRAAAQQQLLLYALIGRARRWSGLTRASSSNSLAGKAVQGQHQVQSPVQVSTRRELVRVICVWLDGVLTGFEPPEKTLKKRVAGHLNSDSARAD